MKLKAWRPGKAGEGVEAGVVIAVAFDEPVTSEFAD